MQPIYTPLSKLENHWKGRDCETSKCLSLILNARSDSTTSFLIDRTMSNRIIITGFIVLLPRIRISRNQVLTKAYTHNSTQFSNQFFRITTQNPRYTLNTTWNIVFNVYRNLHKYIIPSLNKWICVCSYFIVCVYIACLRSYYLIHIIYRQSEEYV